MTPESQISNFRETVWNYYHQSGRHELPWRLPESDDSFDPYFIIVSELMLQQTQVSRVIPKFKEFTHRFPSFEILAAAEQAEVIKAWSGLGYNRRARFLHQTAQVVTDKHAGQLPSNLDELVALPGVGINTAGAILAYAFNQPVVFIETNIRTVYIHHFFSDQLDITDKAILELAEQTLDREHPREWYWALMDYGSHLKQTIGNVNTQSKTYVKQSQFHGSKRQIRGQVLRALADKPLSEVELQGVVNDERLNKVLEDLSKEGLIYFNRHHKFHL